MRDRPAGRTFGSMIKVGISAWTEPTLIDTGWYPPEARDAESRLRFYASRFPLFEDDPRPRHPVGALPVNQVANHIVRTPGVAAFVADDPVVGQATKERIERGGRAGQDGGRLGNRKCASGVLLVCHFHILNGRA